MKQTTQTQRNNIPEIIEHFEVESKRRGVNMNPATYPQMVNRMYQEFMKTGKIETYEERVAAVEKEREYFNVTGEIQ